MPNHVRQRLTVVGAANDVAAFVVTARGARPATGDAPGSLNGNGELHVSPLCFHMIAPLPDSFSAEEYGSGKSVGYELEVKGWGVKWGPYQIADDAPAMSDAGTAATYDFTCAWGPPVVALRRASLRYPTLRFLLSWGGEGPCRGRHAFWRGDVLLEIDDYWRNMAPEMPTDEEYEADEDAASRRSEAAERKYIDSHESWVRSETEGQRAAEPR